MQFYRLHHQNLNCILILKAPITIAADNILIFFVFHFSKKIRLYISWDFSAKQTFHMKHEALFELKKKNLRMLSATILNGAISINPDLAEFIDQQMTFNPFTPKFLK